MPGMNSMTLLLSAVFLFQAAHAEGDAKSLILGAPLTLAEAVPLAEVLAAPERFKDREILVEAVIEKACLKKGCWVILKDGEKEVRTTFKDYGFFVPKDSLGRKVRAQGTVYREMQSVKTLRHYMKDGGASKEEIAKVKAPVEVVSFVASGVVILEP